MDANVKTTSELRHELNNMFNLLLGNLTLLQDFREYPPEETDQIIQDALSAANEADEILRKALSASDAA